MKKVKVIHKLIQKHYNLQNLFLGGSTKNPRQKTLELLPQSPVKILDFCTGTGSNGIYLATHKSDAEIIGIDIDLAALTIARKRIQKNRTDNFSVFRMDACYTIYPDASFDVVTISLVLHEFTAAYQKKILIEANRVLKNNGLILITEWARPKGFFRQFKFWLLYLLEPGSFGEFIKNSFQEQLTNWGFLLTKTIACHYTQIYVLSRCQTNVEIA